MELHYRELEHLRDVRLSDMMYAATGAMGGEEVFSKINELRRRD